MKNEPHLLAVEGKPFGATWLITAPWAHPAWSQYALVLIDLTTPSDQPPVIFLDGATHELLLFALNPSHPATSAQTMVEHGPFHPLSPPNHGYQFKADSDAAAVTRLQKIVDDIEGRCLSPDSDFRAAWDAMFRDAHSLRR